jgi:hypothetical protein
MPRIRGVAAMLAVRQVGAHAEWLRDMLGFEIAFVMEEAGLPHYAVVYLEGAGDVHLFGRPDRAEPPLSRARTPRRAPDRCGRTGRCGVRTSRRPGRPSPSERP